MYKRLLGSLLLVVLYIAANGQQFNNQNLEVKHGPYLQNLKKDGVTIMWQTNLPAVPAVLIESESGGQVLFRNSHDGIYDGGGTNHKVVVTGLNPGEIYKYTPVSTQILKYQAYKVYYGDTLSRKDYSFTTPAETGRDITFTIFNDIHEKSDMLSEFLSASIESRSDLYFFNGDMIDYFQSESQIFDGFLDTAVKYFASEIPFYYVRGNHETRGALARSFKSYFDFRDDRFYYAFTQAGVRFIVLDCGEDKPDNNRYYYGLADYDNYRMEQLSWLKDELKSDEFLSADFKVVLVHMPIIIDDDPGYGEKFLSDNFGPVLSAAKIDLMVSGHTHRLSFLDSSASGFSYPVLISSNKTCIDIRVKDDQLSYLLRDAEGNVLINGRLR